MSKTFERANRTWRGQFLTVTVGGIFLTLGFVLPVNAHKRDFVWTYEWFTPDKQEIEYEFWTTLQQNNGDDKEEYWLEVEVPVTGRWVIAPYLLMENAEGEAFQLKGWKVEQRYRFGEFTRGRFLPAAYLEVKKEKDEPYEMEAKAIFTRIRGDENITLNLIAEKALTAGEEIELEYAAGYSRTWNKRSRWNVETFGNLRKDTYYVGPGVAVDLNAAQRIVFNAAAGLNKRSDDIRLRLIFEHETWR